MDIAGAPAQVAVHAKAGDTVVVEGAGKAGLCAWLKQKNGFPHRACGVYGIFCRAV